jgi:MFS family permease
LAAFYGVSSNAVGYYLIAFAVGNFLGPLLLGRFFDVLGRRIMIAGTYLLSGTMLAITALLFDQGVLSATTQTIAWVVIFFFASAGASAAYLTVSEIFPMETRALAIAFFYAVGTGLGGIIGPVLFGNLIATKRPGPVAFGYLIGAGVVEAFIGVDAEQKPLEEIATPLSEVGDGIEDSARAPIHSLARQTGPAPVPLRRRGAALWSPSTISSTYQRDDPYLPTEVDGLVHALETRSPQSTQELALATGARRWGPRRLHGALRSGLAAGRIRRVGRDRYAAVRTDRSEYVRPGSAELDRADGF